MVKKSTTETRDNNNRFRLAVLGLPGRVGRRRRPRPHRQGILGQPMRVVPAIGRLAPVKQPRRRVFYHGASGAKKGLRF